MVSVDKIERGVANYVDKELMPQFQGGGLEKVIVGTAVSLMIRKSGSIISGYKDNKFVQMLEIMDEKGNVDVNTLAEEIKKNVPKEGFVVDIPMIGTLTFHKEDIDKLHKCIMEG